MINEVDSGFDFGIDPDFYVCSPSLHTAIPPATNNAMTIINAGELDLGRSRGSSIGGRCCTLCGCGGVGVCGALGLRWSYQQVLYFCPADSVCANA